MVVAELAIVETHSVLHVVHSLDNVQRALLNVLLGLNLFVGSSFRLLVLRVIVLKQGGLNKPVNK